jgi:hypothetical protein
MRLLIPSTLAVSLVLALACGGGAAPTASSDAPPAATPSAPPAPPAAPAPPAPPSPSAAAPITPPPPAPPAVTGPFLCCDNERATRVVDAYVDVQSALAKDDDRRAAGELSALQGKADSAKSKGGMDAESNALLTTIRTEANSGLKAGNIEQRRTHFKALSVAMIAFAKKHKGSGTETVAEAWCPMAEGGWLQEGTTLANPYYGAKMLTCGSFK